MQTTPARPAASPAPRQTPARALVAALLCALLVELPLAAEMPATPSSSAKAGPHQIEGDQRILHALNRLTFGPRPGELAEVQRLGLHRWFEQQLNPASIDDSALDARLAAFPAMQLPQADLIHRFPSPQMIRAVIQRDLPLPSDPIEHAIYADGIAFYKQAQARKAAGQTAAGGAANPGQTAAMDSADKAAMQAGADSAPLKSTAAQDATMTAAKSQGQGRGKRGGRVDLLGGDAGGYTMAGKKQASAAQATETPDMAQDEQPQPGRGRPTHNERAFPEADTLQILSLQPEARVQRILRLPPDQLISFRRSLSQSELVALAQDLTPRQKEIFAALQSPVRMVGAEVLQSRIERDVYSNRELEAVMTDFWLNHFNVYIRKNQNEPYLLPAFERDTIRPHALGRFEDLLVATAQSPAMLMYLDNWQSIGPDSDAAHRGARFAGMAKNPKVKQAFKDRGLNENYARELMELHTVGVGCEVSKDHSASELAPGCGNGYTQADVTDVAKVFSGWTIDRPFQGGDFNFEERRHEPGKKSVLGQTIHENGQKEGLEVLHMLAMSPATANFLCTKLAVRFVSDTPPQALVDRMSKSYLSSGGEIRTVLRTMFDSPEFWAPEVYRVKVKTPLEFVASALRATDADISNGVPVVQALDRLGMPLFGMQTPNGYSWLSEPWVSTGALVSRMNFALVLSADRLPGTVADWPLLLGERQPSAQPVAMERTPAGSPANSTPGSQLNIEEQRLERTLLGAPVSARTRQAVVSQSTDSSVPQQAERDFLSDNSEAPVAVQAKPAATPEKQAATMAGLLLGSPEFQRR